MASVKIIHYTNKVYSDGTSPVILQVISGKTIKRKVIASVFADQWNDKDHRVKPGKHKNGHAINATLSDEYNRIEKLIIQGGFDIETIFTPDKTDAITFNEVVKLYLSSIGAKSGYTLMSWSSRYKKFTDYVNNDKLQLSQINYKVIQGYITYLESIGNGPTTIHSALKVLRFVSNFAQKNKICKHSEDLSNFKLPQPKKSIKQKLLPSELEALESLELPAGSARNARNAFLLAIHLRGVRIGDIILLKQSYFKNGRLQYTSGKNGKDFDIELSAKALSIVNEYMDGREYLFPFHLSVHDKKLTDQQNALKQAEDVKRITSNINGRLKKLAEKAGISKNISTHIARHTYAKLAADMIPDRRITMLLLGHSSLADHERYINDVVSTEELDAAAGKIFNGE